MQESAVECQQLALEVQEFIASPEALERSREVHRKLEQERDQLAGSMKQMAAFRMKKSSIQSRKA